MKIRWLIVTKNEDGSLDIPPGIHVEHSYPLSPTTKLVECQAPLHYFDAITEQGIAVVFPHLAHRASKLGADHHAALADHAKAKISKASDPTATVLDVLDELLSGLGMTFEP